MALTTTAALALSGCTKKNESDAAGSGDAGPKTYKVAFVAKLQGVPYFEAMNAGGREAAAALGNVEWLYQGPMQAWAGAQIAQGKTIEATNNVSSDLPAVTYDSASKMLLLGPALAITAENVDQFDY